MKLFVVSPPSALLHDDDFRFEELAHLRRPVSARAAARITDRGIAGDEDRRDFVVLHDFQRAEGRARVVEFEREFFVPTRASASPARNMWTIGTARRVLRRRRQIGATDIRVEGAGFEFPGGRRNIGGQEVPGFGANASCAILPGRRRE